MHCAFFVCASGGFLPRRLYLGTKTAGLNPAARQSWQSSDPFLAGFRTPSPGSFGCASLADLSPTRWGRGGHMPPRRSYPTRVATEMRREYTSPPPRGGEVGPRNAVTRGRVRGP